MTDKTMKEEKLDPPMELHALASQLYGASPSGVDTIADKIKAIAVKLGAKPTLTDLPPRSLAVIDLDLEANRAALIRLEPELDKWHVETWKPGWDRHADLWKREQDLLVERKKAEELVAKQAEAAKAAAAKAAADEAAKSKAA